MEESKEEKEGSCASTKVWKVGVCATNATTAAANTALSSSCF